MGSSRASREIGLGATRSGPFARALRLREQVFEVALLLLEPALALVRTAFPLELLVARQGTAGFFHPALGPVHRSLIFVFPASPAWHDRSLLLVGLLDSLYPAPRPSNPTKVNAQQWFGQEHGHARTYSENPQRLLHGGGQGFESLGSTLETFPSSSAAHNYPPPQHVVSVSHGAGALKSDSSTPGIAI